MRILIPPTDPSARPSAPAPVPADVLDPSPRSDLALAAFGGPVAAAQAELGRVLDEQSRGARRLRQGARSHARAAAAEARLERREAIDARHSAGRLGGALTAVGGAAQFLAIGADDATKSATGALFGEQGMASGIGAAMSSGLEARASTHDVDADGLEAEATVQRDLAADLTEVHESAEARRSKVANQLAETLRAQLEARRARIHG